MSRRPLGTPGVRTLYNILFAISFVLSSPYYFLKMWRRGNWVPGFFQRFGRFDPNVMQALTNRQVLWLHAVSVGEVNLCTQLIRALEPRLPNVTIVVQVLVRFQESFLADIEGVLAI